jgi:16S rRNA (cytosine1402-N4)-methyltransferase
MNRKACMGADYHIPVLRDEVLEYLQVREGGFYIDCTLGGGGHAEAMLDRGAAVLGIDRDRDAIEYATERLKRFGERFRAERARFSELEEVAGIHLGAIDGVLMDLGVSSRMIDDPEKGFSYLYNGPLSMDMGLSGTSAYEVVNSRDVSSLTAIFREYGEERQSRRIAEAIVHARSSKPLATTRDLSELIERVVGGKLPQKSKARIFQALRIAVNDELGELRTALAASLRVLRSGGRLGVISYHSLEDRLVKEFMRSESSPCICPPDLPECRCGRKPTLSLVTRKPVRAGDREVAHNVRARSALFRIAERTTEDCGHV